LFNWKKKGWVKVKNPDLWKLFLELYTAFKPKMQWVKGHAGIAENERCDFLATQAASEKATGIDAWYEANRNAADGLF
jgi:ribonuclease HI